MKDRKKGFPQEVKQEGKIKAIRVYVVHGDGSEGLISNIPIKNLFEED